MADRDHRAALDGLRAELVEQLGEIRAHIWWSRGYRNREYRTVTFASARRKVAQLRALDAVRAALRDRRVSAEAWMLIACGKPHLTAFAEARAMVAATPEVPEQ